ncbi:MAG: hypothetical protein PHT79_11000 [Syntrophomonadaceae bacterium]|nr:hypothetical protein [Syntrophomonadaceae bacterium]MDD3889450.1 hypothetical protein [Syntrophomonadaceae bacterium]MDD4550272.1 hypothetical protein [Syntrophomonadaceae bacterium]
MFLLATGLNIEEKLESEKFKRCYDRSVILDVVKELNPEAIVLSPLLNGDEDILHEVIIPLREAGERIIFLPGDINLPDARDWLRKLLPWGVYCYVFDPVTPEKIIHRINNPGKIGDLPEELLNMNSEEVQEVIGYVKDEIPVKNKSAKILFRKPKEVIKKEANKADKKSIEKTISNFVKPIVNKQLVLLSPKSKIGVTELTYILSQILSANIVEANTNPSMMDLFNIPQRERWALDWRINPEGFIMGSNKYWLLDPNKKDPIEKSQLEELLYEVIKTNTLTLWDGGSSHQFISYISSRTSVWAITDDVDNVNFTADAFVVNRGEPDSRAIAVIPDYFEYEKDWNRQINKLVELICLRSIPVMLNRGL